MAFPPEVYALALLSGLGTTALAVPVLSRWCAAIGHVDAPGGRKLHPTPVPLAGGLAVMAGFLIPLALGYVFLQAGETSLGPLQLVAHGLTQRMTRLGAILAGAMGMVVLGWLDDRHDLAPGPKFCGQFLVAALVAWAGIRITMFVPNAAFSYVVTILWMLALINAFNFVDNMNGLCAGLGVISAAACALSAASQGQYLVALLGFQICGALLGFLPFNFPRASVFLGDSGSHLVGYLVAVLAIMPIFYSARTPNPLAVLTPLFIVVVPLVDLTAVVVRRWRMGKPIYVGDTNHLSHRVARWGLSHAQAVLLLWACQAVAATLAVLTFRHLGIRE